MANINATWCAAESRPRCLQLDDITCMGVWKEEEEVGNLGEEAVNIENMYMEIIQNRMNLEEKMR